MKLKEMLSLLLTGKMVTNKSGVSYKIAYNDTLMINNGFGWGYTDQLILDTEADLTENQPKRLSREEAMDHLLVNEGYILNLETKEVINEYDSFCMVNKAILGGCCKCDRYGNPLEFSVQSEEEKRMILTDRIHFDMAARDLGIDAANRIFKK